MVLAVLDALVGSGSTVKAWEIVDSSILAQREVDTSTVTEGALREAASHICSVRLLYFPDIKLAVLDWVCA